MPAFLARRYVTAVDVERRDDAPVAFTWRGRRYAVAAVLDHWWETVAWWSTAQRSPAGGAGDLSGVVSDDEREFWRVEARPVHGAGANVPAVVDLAFAWVTGRWTVDAVLD
jgi:hypothetical protein